MATTKKLPTPEELETAFANLLFYYKKFTNGEIVPDEIEHQYLLVMTESLKDTEYQMLGIFNRHK